MVAGDGDDLQAIYDAMLQEEEGIHDGNSMTVD